MICLSEGIVSKLSRLYTFDSFLNQFFFAYLNLVHMARRHLLKKDSSIVILLPFFMSQLALIPDLFSTLLISF